MQRHAECCAGCWPALAVLQADASRLVQQGLPLKRRMELISTRHHTVMAPVLAQLQQHLAAAAAAPPGSPDEAAFRQQMLPQLQDLLSSLQQPPAELLRAVEAKQQDAAELPPGTESKVCVDHDWSCMNVPARTAVHALQHMWAFRLHCQQGSAQVTGPAPCCRCLPAFICWGRWKMCGAK